MQKRKYAFSWNLIDDIDLGRPNLGATTRIEVYRLMRFRGKRDRLLMYQGSYLSF
jgi:hypothetical protein